MQRVVAAPRELAVDRDQVLHARHLARQHDPVAREADPLGEPGALQRRPDERLARDADRVERGRRARVLVHQRGQQLLVEAAPVDADAHRLAELDRALDHHGELRVVLRAAADVARVDPVFRERLRARGVLREQLVAVEMEVADQRRLAADRVEPVADGRHRVRGFGGVDGDADELGACVGERLHLRDRRGDVGRVGVGHRLDDDRRVAADRDVPHAHGARAAADDVGTAGSAHGARALRVARGAGGARILPSAAFGPGRA